MPTYSPVAHVAGIDDPGYMRATGAMSMGGKPTGATRSEGRPPRHPMLT
jgi:hypothetical protein